MQLNRDVLPAPLGPTSPRMLPGSTLKLTSLSTVTPPKRRLTSCKVSWEGIALHSFLLGTGANESAVAGRRARGIWPAVAPPTKWIYGRTVNGAAWLLRTAGWGRVHRGSSPVQLGHVRRHACHGLTPVGNVDTVIRKTIRVGCLTQPVFGTQYRTEAGHEKTTTVGVSQLSWRRIFVDSLPRAGDRFRTVGYGAAWCAELRASTPLVRQVGLQFLEQRSLGARPGNRVQDLSILEEFHRWDRDDLVAQREVLVLVDIDFDDVEILSAFGCDLVEDRAQGAAGSAPFRPEVHED